MSELLSKDRLLEGAARRETVSIESVGGNVVIRPLTCQEWFHAQALIGKHYNPNPNARRIVTDPVEAFEAISESKIYTCLCGLVDPQLEEEELKKLPVGVILEISEKIEEISGVNIGKEEIEPFRQV